MIVSIRLNRKIVALNNKNSRALGANVPRTTDSLKLEWPARDKIRTARRGKCSLVMRLAESIETPRAIHPPQHSIACQLSGSRLRQSQSHSFLRAQGLPIMLPAKRNKVDISVRISFDPKSAITSSIAHLTTTACDSERMHRYRRRDGC